MLLLFLWTCGSPKPQSEDLRLEEEVRELRAENKRLAAALVSREVSQEQRERILSDDCCDWSMHYCE